MAVVCVEDWEFVNKEDEEESNVCWVEVLLCDVAFVELTAVAAELVATDIDVVVGANVMFLAAETILYPSIPKNAPRFVICN